MTDEIKFHTIQKAASVCITSAKNVSGDLDVDPIIALNPIRKVCSMETIISVLYHDLDYDPIGKLGARVNGVILSILTSRS